MNKKVLIIGIDGGTWNILQTAMDQGYMPTLKELIASGGSGVLESTIPAITPSAWSSFQTGINVGRSGIFHFGWWDRKTHRTHIVSSADLGDTLWETLSNTGKKVGVLNVPMTYPPRKINGYMVTGVLTPSLESEFTYPVDLKHELLENVPDYQFLNTKNFKIWFTDNTFEQQVIKMAELLEIRVRAALFILKKDTFDVFMVHFQASDILQHGCWGCMTEQHPNFDLQKQTFIFETFYRRMDEAIAQVRKGFSENTGGDYLNLIVSDHGFESHFKKFHLANWLCDEGFMKIQVFRHKPTLLKKITSTLKVGKLLGLFLPKKLMQNTEKALGLKGSQFDWEHTSVYCFTGGSGEGFLYVLEDNADKRRKIVSDILNKLNTFRDPENETKVLVKAYLKEEMFSCDNIERMPDIIIEPAAGYSFYGTYKHGEEILAPVDFNEELHIGKHHRDGIIVACGHGVAKKNHLRLRITDVVPTILYFMQVPLSNDYDGIVCTELFSEDFIFNNPPLIYESSHTQSVKEDTEMYSQDDQMNVMKRLEDLGYL